MRGRQSEQRLCRVVVASFQGREGGTVGVWTSLSDSQGGSPSERRAEGSATSCEATALTLFLVSRSQIRIRQVALAHCSGRRCGATARGRNLQGPARGAFGGQSRVARVVDFPTVKLTVGLFANAVPGSASHQAHRTADPDTGRLAFVSSQPHFSRCLVLAHFVSTSPASIYTSWPVTTSTTSSPLVPT